MVSGVIDSLDRKFWGASRGRSAIDCAWLQAARAEANQADSLHSALWVIDWPKYYESIPLPLLRVKCIRVGIPACWLKLVCNARRAPRIIRCGRHRAQ
eukprot:5267862-Pyramimonas_sp.AAC.1